MTVLRPGMRVRVKGGHHAGEEGRIVRVGGFENDDCGFSIEVATAFGLAGERRLFLYSENLDVLPEMNFAKHVEQPDPIPNDHPAVWDLVLADIGTRDKQGEAKYRVRLQPHNGRDFLRDAYEEALDLVVYLRGAIFERDGK